MWKIVSENLKNKNYLSFKLKDTESQELVAKDRTSNEPTALVSLGHGSVLSMSSSISCLGFVTVPTVLPEVFIVSIQSII